MFTNVFISPPPQKRDELYEVHMALRGVGVDVSIGTTEEFGYIYVTCNTAAQAAGIASAFTQAAIELGRRETGLRMVRSGKP